MRRLLAGNGAIFIQTDWHIGHYIKVIADEIFRKENFLREANEKILSFKEEWSILENGKLRC